MKILIVLTAVICVCLYGSINLAPKPLKNDIHALHIHEQMKRYMPIQIFEEQPVIWQTKHIKRNPKLKPKESNK